MAAFAVPAHLPARGIRPMSTYTSQRVVICCADSKRVSRFSVGDSVRVSKSPLILYVVPGKKNEACDVHGMCGKVQKIISTVNGVYITATKPVVVAFDEPKFRAHFDDDELEDA